MTHLCTNCYKTHNDYDLIDGEECPKCGSNRVYMCCANCESLDVEDQEPCEYCECKTCKDCLSKKEGECSQCHHPGQVLKDCFLCGKRNICSYHIVERIEFEDGKHLCNECYYYEAKEKWNKYLHTKKY